MAVHKESRNRVGQSIKMQRTNWKEQSTYSDPKNTQAATTLKNKPSQNPNTQKYEQDPRKAASSVEDRPKARRPSPKMKTTMYGNIMPTSSSGAFTKVTPVARVHLATPKP